MGFLDHSTNNIILDAVLTDLGRSALSRNDGSFSIFKFGFADDEVDYTIIQQFGRTVGKEKIEKNTPILEATTQANLGIKHKLVSFNNSSLTRLPTLIIDTSLTDDTVQLARNATSSEPSSKVITLSQYKQGGGASDADEVDYSFNVTLAYGFLRLANVVPDSVDNMGTAKYTVEADATISSMNTSSLTLTLISRQISDDAFGASSVDGTYVYRPVSVTGINTGIMKTFMVRIS